MEAVLIKLSLERLLQKVENLEQRNLDLTERICLLELRQSDRKPDAEPVVSNDHLLDTREVQQLLGICYNTLQKLVGKGLLCPIRISARRIRYSKNAVQAYINSRSG